MDIMEPGYKMLGSSGTQYLNPDYIQPLPTTLDSKNSPLALLAQTCSSIGKDSGSSSKLSLPPMGEKKDSSSSSSSSSNHHRESVKDCKQQRSSDSPMGCSAPGSSSRTSGDTGRSNKATSSDKSSSSKDCSSRSSSGGGGESSPKSRVHSSRPLSSLVSLGNGSGKCTPSSANTFSSGSGSLHRDYSSASRGSATISSTSVGGVALPPSSALNNNNKTMGEMGSNSLLYDPYSDDILKSSGLASSTLLQHQHSFQEALRLQHEGLQSLQAAAAAGLGPLPSGYPPLLFGHPLAAAAALDPLMYSYSASLAAVHGLALSSHKLPTLSPYMGYARVSTASGGSTLVPVCKDPYCTTGSMHSGHGLQQHAPPSGSASAPCGAGCTQCGSSATTSAQDKSHRCTVTPPVPTSLTNGGLGGSAGQYSSSLYSLSLPPGGLSNPLLGMAAAAHLGVGLTPYACSWLSGGEFCGKRFSKAEDLLQHLRTHASSGETAAAALPAFSLSGVPLPSPAGFPGAGHPFSIPGSLSPSSMLQQAGGQVYPRSLSPNSLLSASRYHPYKSPFAAVLPTSTVSGTLGGAGSALDAYYSSPYALYGHRIGAAAVGP